MKGYLLVKVMRCTVIGQRYSLQIIIQIFGSSIGLESDV